MATRPINVKIEGQYSDKDIKRAIRDLQSLQTQAPRTSKAMSGIAKGMAVAGAAAAALAVKIGVDAVQAAMEEEQSVGRLATTLKNLGLATEQAGVEKFIDDMQYATGIADQDLRPAMDRLVRSTGDVGEAQRALAIATDIAVAKQRPVVDVANILAKAYDGNTMALGRLGVGLDRSVLKSGDMAEITGRLSDLFAGQAAAASDTLAGKLKILSMAGSELSESFGQGLIKGFTDSLSDGTGNIDDATAKLREMQATADTWGQVIGDAAAFALNGLDMFGLGAMKVADTFNDAAALIIRAYINVADALGLMSDEEGAAARANLDAADAQREAAMRAYALKGATDSVTSSTEAGTSAMGAYSGGIQSTTTQAGKAKTALQRLQAQMDRMSKNRSIAGQRIGLAQMRQEGPGKGENVREFGLNFADQASSLAFDITERGGKGSKRRARRVLSNAREYLASLGLGKNFTSAQGKFLGTPEELLPGTAQQRAAAGQNGRQATTINYNFGGDIVVRNVEEAQQQAKRMARLRGLSNRGAQAALVAP